MYRLTKNKTQQLNKQAQLSSHDILSGVIILLHLCSVVVNILLDQDHRNMSGNDNEFLSFISKKRDKNII